MRSKSRWTVLVALSLLVSACGDDPKKKPADNNQGDGDGDAAGDGDGDGKPGPGDSDAQVGDGDGDVIVDLDAGTEDAGEDPLEVLKDAGPDAAIATPDGGTISADEYLAQEALKKLRSCKTPNVIVGGDGEFNVGLVEDDYDRCIASCIVKKQTTCSQLHTVLCKGVASPYSTCTSGCKKPADGFLCGDGSRILHALRCDDDAFLPRCPGGEDELNCPPRFVCKDGDTIPAKFECDGMSVKGADTSLGGCKDGSDEDPVFAGCALFCPAP